METSEWERLGIPGTDFAEARRQCHHAAQINTRLVRGFAEAQSDDSHTSMSWDPAESALVGREVSSFRLGLRIAELTLVLLGRSGQEIRVFPLDGRTPADALDWLGSYLSAAGLDPAPLMQPIHFELEDHPLLHGAAFRRKGSEPFFGELAKWYGNAALCLGTFGLPVRCWPHHFDIAALIANGEGSIGAGMSPGDGSYDQPYFYVTPWPYPAAGSLSKLAVGNWHTEGWVGAVLTATDVLRAESQRQLVEQFLSGAVAAVTG
jgi:hypothetical protein